MFARHQPSSPLSTISYTNTHLQTPDHHAPVPLTTPSKPVAHPSPAFPPPLGSSSPPMSSPTSFRISERARSHSSSAGLFAARARAVQPPLQRSSSLVQHGSGSSNGFHVPSEGRYGPRPGMKKVSAGPVASTGFALHRPLSAREDDSRRQTTTTGEASIQGSMWRGKFRRRCLAVSRRQGDADEVEDGDAEAEHEEIFRRMIQKEHRRAAHRIAVSYEHEVGGSDPAVWDADVRDAEREGSPAQPREAEDTTPERNGAQWQYRSTSKHPHRPPGVVRHSSHSSSLDPAADDDAAQAQLAQFLRDQEEEDRLVAEYAAELGAADGDDTPGGELGLEMEGFTWDDQALSDEGDVEMA